MSKKSLHYIFLILVCVLWSVPAQGEDIKETWRKWTFRLSTSGTSIGRMKLDATMLSDDLVHAWLDAASSDSERESIATLYSTAQEQGLAVFIVKIRMRSNHEFVYADFGDIDRSATLFVGDGGGRGVKPEYYTGNANSRLYGGQDYYVFLAFRVGGDPFSFKTLSLQGRYVNEGIQEYNNRRNPKRPRVSEQDRDFQFAFLPFGVEECNRPGSSPDVGDIITLLRFALKIITKLG